MNEVHVVVPEGIDDPARPSGGNAYDRRVCDGLEATGWTVRLHPVPGRWPQSDATSHAALGDVVGRVPDGAVVLLDGLVASTAPVVLVPHASRLRMVALVHMPLGLPRRTIRRVHAKERCSAPPRPWSRPAPGRGGC